MDRAPHKIVTCLLLLCIAVNASASGWWPWTQPDSITVYRGGTANRLDNGNASVLDNDWDWEGDRLTAVLDDEPRRGSIDLRPDGTFVYTHDGGNQNSDSFSYRAFDGTGNSRSTQVSISIEDVPNAPPQVIGNVDDQQATVGTRFELALADYFTDPDPDDALTYSARGLPSSDSLTIDPVTGLLSGTPLERDVRSRAYDVEITARDRAGATARIDFDLLIEEIPNEPPQLVGQVGDQEAEAETPFELALAEYFTDPDPDDVLTFSASGLPGSNSLTMDPVTGVLSGTPLESDARSQPYNVAVTARDRAGESATMNFGLLIQEVRRPDLALEVRVVTNPIGVGETSRWDIVIDNIGRGELEIGTLSAQWVTAGPALSVSAPAGCALSDNNTQAPQLSCDIAGLGAGEAATFAIEGVQDGAGDNSLIAVAVADDPQPGNNAGLASANIVAAFSEGPTQTIDFAGTGIDAGDLDGDGDIDVVAAGNETAIYFNNGNRSLAASATSLGGSTGATSVSLLDWNADSHLDIAIGGLDGFAAEIFVNDGAGQFTSAARVGNNYGAVRAVAGADFNGDGLSELVIAGASGLVVARNDGQGGAAVRSLSAAGALSTTAVDIDRDGDQDIVAIRPGNRMVGLYYNDGSGASFSASELQFGSVGTVNVADINGDGAPDLLLGLDGDDLQAPLHQVAFQQGNGQFSAGQSFGASPVATLLTGDVDGDGWTDIAAINEAGVHQVYLGSSQGSLSLAPEQLVSEGMSRGVLVDFNDDESLDLLLIGPGSAGLEIHANNGIGRLGRGDRVAPELRLLGETSISIPAGGEYIEAGATATDDIDGNLTSRITISGTINTSAVGTQTLTYRVSDRAGNTASAVRTIKVGVNEGTGGSGSGAISPAWLLLLLWLAVARRSRTVGRWR